MTQSILSKVRAEAYAEGYAQASMVESDLQFENMRLDVLKSVDGEHRRWCAFGFICGIGLSAIVAAFT